MPHVYLLVRICFIAHIIAMTQALNLLAALAEPTRLAAVRLLWDGQEHCVCELMEQLGATQSRTSRHMATLKAAGLVVDRRDAQWVRYRRSSNLSPDAERLVNAALALAAQRERGAA